MGGSPFAIWWAGQPLCHLQHLIRPRSRGLDLFRATVLAGREYRDSIHAQRVLDDVSAQAGHPALGEEHVPAEIVSDPLAAHGGGVNHKGWSMYRLAYTEEVAGSTPASPTK